MELVHDNLCEAQALSFFFSFNHWLARPLHFDRDEIAVQGKVLDFATRSHHRGVDTFLFFFETAALTTTIVLRLLSE